MKMSLPYAQRVEMLDIASLIAAATEEVPEAFDEIVRRYQMMVIRTARHIVLNAEDAQDVAQDVFISVLKNLGRFRHDSAFSTWLTRIAINTSLMHLRKQRRSRCVSLDEAVQGELSPYEYLEASDRSPEYLLLNVEKQAMLKGAIQRLPETLREITTERLEKDFAIDELAHRRGLTTAAAKSRLLRARRALIASIQKDMRTPPMQRPIASA